MRAFIERKAELIKETDKCFRVMYRGKAANWNKETPSGDILTDYDPVTDSFRISGWIARAVEKFDARLDEERKIAA